MSADRGERSEITSEVLIQHLNGMGLDTTDFKPEFASFANFEINKENGSMFIEVSRPNGNLVSCELYRAGDDNKKGVYLFVASEYPPGQYDPFGMGKIKEVSVYGTFPVQIKQIMSSENSGSDGHRLCFKGKEGLCVINESGIIIFHP